MQILTTITFKTTIFWSLKFISNVYFGKEETQIIKTVYLCVKNLIHIQLGQKRS